MSSGKTIIGLALVVVAALGGCTSFAPKPPPPYAGADTIEAVDATAFIGDWRLIALNPREDDEVPERTLTYASDGTFTGEIQPTADMAEMTGGQPMTMSGSWRVDGGALVHATQELKMPGEDLASRLASSFLKNRPSLAARAEVYEISPTRIVIVSDDGYATAFERL